MCLGAMEVGVPPWASVAALAIALGMSHIRATMRERHIEEMDFRQMAQAAVKMAAAEVRVGQAVVDAQRSVPPDEPATAGGKGPKR